MVEYNKNFDSYREARRFALALPNAFSIKRLYAGEYRVISESKISVAKIHKTADQQWQVQFKTDESLQSLLRRAEHRMLYVT